MTTSTQNSWLMSKPFADDWANACKFVSLGKTLDMVGGIFMSRFKKKYIAVRVSYLNGKQVELQLPKDLQKPMWHYIHEHPHD